MSKPIPKHGKDSMKNSSALSSIFDVEVTDKMRQRWADRERRKNILNIIYGVVMVVGTVVVVSLLAREYFQCTARGGAYVKSMFWYSCIEAR